MKSRIRSIIEILISEEHPFTAKELSLRMDVSEKTIHEDLQRFCDNQKNYPIKIEQKRNSYSILQGNLSSEEKERFLDVLDYSLGSSSDRTQYILRRILFHNGYTKLEELADEMYVSMATANRAMKKVKQVLTEYKLQIVSKPGYGISVQGDEINKRLCHVHCLSLLSGDNAEMIAQLCEMKPEDYYNIDYIIRKALEKSQFDLTETGIKNLIVHLMYAITRMKNGNLIQRVKSNYPISKKETELAKNIVEEIEVEYSLEFPMTEIDYVQIHLLSKRANMENKTVSISNETEEIIYSINREIRNVLKLDFANDFELFSLLAQHIEPMLSRLEYGIKLSNPVLHNIKAEWPMAYECAVVAANCIKEQYGFSVPDDEMGYIALHYGLALERQNEGQTDLKLLVVCGSGGGTAKLVQKKIERRFGIDNKNISLCSIRELKNHNFSMYDFIVSTVKIPFHIEKRIIYIDNILSDFAVNSDSDDSLILKYIDEELVFWGKDLKTKNEALDFICGKVMEKRQLSDEFRDLVWKRENLSSTDIGNLVAIPHPYLRCTKETVFSFCSLKKAINWKRRKVKYIFLISFGKDDLEASHDFNEKLLFLIMDTKWIAMLETVSNIDELKKLLK